MSSQQVSHLHQSMDLVLLFLIFKELYLNYDFIRRHFQVSFLYSVLTLYWSLRNHNSNLKITITKDFLDCQFIHVLIPHFTHLRPMSPLITSHWSFSLIKMFRDIFFRQGIPLMLLPLCDSWSCCHACAPRWSLRRRLYRSFYLMSISPYIWLLCLYEQSFQIQISDPKNSFDPYKHHHSHKS